jgi:hypothetical protein
MGSEIPGSMALPAPDADSVHAGGQTNASLAVAAGLILAASVGGLVLGSLVEGEEAAGGEAEGEELLEEIGGGWAG